MNTNSKSNDSKSNPALDFLRICWEWIKTNFHDILLGKCWEWIRTNYLTIIVTIVLVLAFLYFEDTLVDAFFSFIRKTTESPWGLNILRGLGSLLLIAIIYDAIKAVISKTLSDGRTYLLSLVLCSLFAYCMIRYPWEMNTPEKSNPIAGHEWAFIVLFAMYALRFLVLPIILYFFVNHKTHKHEKLLASTESRYLSDTPITSLEEDELGFEDHIIALKNLIDDIPISGTHSIAITGGWGSGKTSFLNLFQQKLNNQNQYEVVWFHPMKSSKSDNIQNDFFDVLESSLSKYKTGFGRRLKYYKELIGAIDNNYVSFLLNLGSIRLEDEKKRINDAIKMIPKRIIVIIDDADRLQEDEIMQVFRLVGYNARFNNIVFLVALDKRNIIKNLHCDDNYPDKFFEMEFPLPDNFRKNKSKFVNKALMSYGDDNIQIQHDFQKNLEDENVVEYTAYCIDSLRDAIRFLNYFGNRLKLLPKELNQYSYYLLSLIRYKDPSFYDLIESKVLLEKDTAQANKFVLNKKETDSSEHDPKLVKILKDLFSYEYEPQIQEDKTKRHHIFQPEYFEDYFNETDNEMMELLSEPDLKELEKTLEKLRNDEKTIVMLKKSVESNYYMKLLNRDDSERLIINYYKALGIMGIENGLEYDDELAPVKINERKYVYINEQGSDAVRIEFDCDSAKDFCKGLAGVMIKDKWGFINKEGKTIIKARYDEVREYREGLVSVKKGNKWGFIDKDDKPKILFQYDDAGNFREGLAKVKKNGKWGFIDKQKALVDKGKEPAIDYKYVEARDFREGLASVKIGDKWGFIDKKDELVIEAIYDRTGDFREGLASVKKNGKWGFIDKEKALVNKGEDPVIDYQYEEARGFREGLAGVKKNGKWGFINHAGNPVIPLEFDKIGNFKKDGLAKVKKNGERRVVDKNGIFAK